MAMRLSQAARPRPAGRPATKVHAAITSKAVRCAKMRLVAVMAIAAAALIPMSRAAADGPYFYIMNSGTGMTAEVFAHHTEDGSAVVLWGHYGGESEQFAVESDGNFLYSDEDQQTKWFLLRARHSGKCLKTDGWQSGAPVVQAECSGDASQLWRVRTISMTAAECADPGQCFGGYRRLLENYYDRGRRCLDAANGAFPTPPPEGAGLQAWDCIAAFSSPNAVNQGWELVYTEHWGQSGPIVK